MTHTYNITGLTCNGCVAKAKSELLKIDDITIADVQLAAPQAAITMQKHIPIEVLQSALRRGGNYIISNTERATHQAIQDEPVKSWLETYRPLLIIFSYIIGTTLLLEISHGAFLWDVWMQNFMAAFFLVFSFFKLLDVKGFAESYASYDIIAKRWMGWGYVYAFIELALGIAYLLKLNLVFTNAVTFVIMSVSIIGVLQSVAGKKKIKCACLGSVFNLPMTTVTIIEDALMIAMSAAMFVAAL